MAADPQPDTDNPVATKEYVDAHAGGAVDSVNGQTGAVVLTKSDVGLGNADNTSDADKPVSDATQAALDAKADDDDVLHLAGGVVSGDLAVQGATSLSGAFIKNVYSPFDYTTAGGAQLAANINTTASTIVVDDSDNYVYNSVKAQSLAGGGMQVPFALLIDSEILIANNLPTGMGTATCTFTGVLRRRLGTSSASHVVGADVRIMAGDYLVIPKTASAVIANGGALSLGGHVDPELGANAVSIVLPPLTNIGAWQAPPSGWTCDIGVPADPSYEYAELCYPSGFSKVRLGWIKLDTSVADSGGFNVTYKSDASGPSYAINANYSHDHIYP